MNSVSNISAVIITKDEEEYIGQCIRSLKKVADEIIVVDSFSKDQTVAISEQLGAVVIKKDWLGYAKTKNLGNSMANNDWVLSIDADEELSEELENSILLEKNKGLNKLAVYKWNRLNNYCGSWIKHAGWYPDTKVRLFPKESTRWEGSVHEKLVHSKPVYEKWLKGDLLHYTVASKEDHLTRLLKYNELSKPYPNRLVSGFSALATFIRMYVLKGGFLDGKMGFQLCLISAKAKWMRV